MHPSRRRKKRPNYGIRTVEVMRGPNGFGFTISGQQPCILSCIVSNSPADQAGLRAGDFLISVNGVSVSKITHDAVVGLIGNCVGPIKMTIAENYYSDSSDEELDCGRMVNSRKPKYMHKPRARASKGDLRRTAVETSEKNVIKMRECLSKQGTNDSRLNANVFNEEPANDVLNISNPMPMEDEAGPIEYKALVGYLGTIEMPKQLLPNSRLQTVCSCIRKLRQEKRTPTAVLMTILPTCLTLKNASNHILAIYPTNRVVYVGSTADRESRYFGLVTSAVCDTRSNECLQKHYGQINWQQDEKKFNNVDNGVEISNSCHVFVTDPKIVDHNIHQKKAESFKITCTTDAVTGNCLEFPRNALYIVSLVQNMYKLQNSDGNRNNDNLGPLVANSPQPSASSNSDSGIGFRDDCGNISDRILVVEFPMHRSLPLLNKNNRPLGIDASNMPLEGLDLPLNNDQPQSFELNNLRCQNNLVLDRQNNLSKSDNNEKNSDMRQLNNLNNIRACEGVNIKNQLEKSESLLKNDYLLKQNNDVEYAEYNKLTCRAMPDAAIKVSRGLSPTSVISSDDNTRNADIDTGLIYMERAVDVPDNSPSKKSYECVSLHSVTDELDFKSSVDNVSMHSSKSIEFANLMNVFKAPFESKKSKRQLKMVSSCDNLDKYNENIMNYKLSPKVYGLSKPNYSCEELNNFDSVEKHGYGSLQDLYSWNEQGQTRRNIAQSEPDVRITRNVGSGLCDQNGVAKCSNTEGPAGWATSFEKLLEDPLGLHTFAEFLKKEFSAENIYFWTACERYRRLPPGNEKVAEAQRIYQQHLSLGAPEAVNVDAQGRQYTEQSLQDPDSNLFDLAQKQIFNLMKFDSYPRFLKSDIYKQCLSGDIEKPALDAGLMLQMPTSTPSKLKKSLSNAEDRRRKSLLPWHRKNRSKSKDRGEVDYIQRRNDIIASNENIDEPIGKNVGSDMHSSHSSLTSLDLAITSQDSTKPRLNNQEELTVNGGRTSLCRVLLSNGSTTVVQIKESETIQQLVTRLLDKRGIVYSSFEVFTNKHPKPMDASEPSTKLAGCEVTVEQRVVFKLDLPNRKIISVKSKYTKIIVDVLRPILHKYQYNLDQVVVTNGNIPIDLHLPVTSIDGARLNVQLREDIKEDRSNTAIRVNNVKANKLDEITNKVFEGILQEKADSCSFKPTKSDKGSVKSEDWGSEHSSGIFGKFLRRDSGVHERKKKIVIPRFKGNSNNGSSEDVQSEQNQIKKPLIAKWKAGANKLHVTCSESDELVEGLTRAQRCRLEDQRGTEINFELPDFLKDKENEHNFHKPLRRAGESDSNTRFYLGETGAPSKLERIPAVASTKNLKLALQSNYENRNVLVPSESPTRVNSGKFGAGQDQQQQAKESSNSKASSPSKLSEEGSRSNQSTPSKCSSLENTVIENKSPARSSDPPPLPPKPKIVPIKPPNWGQLNGFHKTKDVSLPNSDRGQQAMFLEQPSSSFV